MTTQPSSLRLNAPQPQMYETSPGETAVLRGLNENNLGAMYGMLLGQRTDNQNRQYDYEQQLAGVNQGQQALAQRSLANDETESRRGAVLKLVEHGNLPTAAALRSLDLSGLPAYLSERQGAERVEGADAARLGLQTSKAYEQSNTGAYQGVQAGLNPIPSQSVPTGPNGALSLNRTVGTPLTLRREELEQAGKARTATADAARVTGTYSPLSDETVVQAKGTPEQVRASLRPFIDEARNGRPKTGGADTAGAAANRQQVTGTQTGPAAGTPAPARRTTGGVTDEQRTRARQALGASGVLGYQRDVRTGRLVAIGANGRTAPIE